MPPAPELKGPYYFANFQRRYKFPKRKYNLDIKGEIDREIAALKSKGRILDAGCGDGALSKDWTGTHDVYGVDCQKEAIDFCQRQYPQGNWQLQDL